MAALNTSTIGVIEVNGTITGGINPNIMDSGGSNSQEIMQGIRAIAKRKDIKAVILRINSPGGSSVASEEIALEVDKLRESGIPVITSMGEICTSGGYWIACSSDYIVANSGILTGSIGVIMKFSYLEGLYDKLGISHEVIKGGQFKDMGSANRKLEDKERLLFEQIVKERYTNFL